MDEQAEKARKYFSGALDAYMRENPAASVAEVREFTLDLFGSALPNFTDLTETLACDLFDEIAEECGFEGERARLYDTTDYQVVEDKVRYFAGLLADDDAEQFKREVADVTRYFCKRAAFDNMVENCRAQKIKWARMPTGFETCPFCFMLSSRGFVYASEKTASEGHHGYHDNCDCVPVPGFQDAKGNPRVKIDGYDPETMFRNWSMCEKFIGGREQARAEWLALPEDVRSGYIERHGNASKAFACFEQNRIQNEVATRDWHWLYTGEAPLRVQRYTANEVLPDMKGQFGKKVKRHAADWELDPKSEHDRQRLFEIARNIIENATEVFPRDEWRGQPDKVVFYLLGNDVVMTKPNGEYITIMKDAAVKNKKVIYARNQNTKRQQ